MKKLIVSALILALWASWAQAFDAMLMEQQAQRLRSQIELQVEKIRRAREVADYRVSQRLMQLEEQLRLSEEDLERRVEELREIQQQLRSQMETTSSGIIDSREELRATLQEFFADVLSQIEQTNGLIARVREIRQRLQRIHESNGQNSGDSCSEGSAIRGGSSSVGLDSGGGDSSGLCPSCGEPTAGGGASLSEIEKELAQLQQRDSTAVPNPTVASPDTQTTGGG